MNYRRNPYPYMIYSIKNAVKCQAFPIFLNKNRPNGPCRWDGLNG